MSAYASLPVTTSIDRVPSLYRRWTGLNVGICMPGCHQFHRPCPVLVREIDRTQCPHLHALLSPHAPTVSRPCTGDRQDFMSAFACLASNTSTDCVPSLYGRYPGLYIGICMPGCHHFHRPCFVLLREIHRTKCRHLHTWLSPLPPTVSSPCTGDRQDSMSASACLAVTTSTDRVPSLYGR
jgi:hypothetical protein